MIGFGIALSEPPLPSSGGVVVPPPTNAYTDESDNVLTDESGNTLVQET